MHTGPDALKRLPLRAKTVLYIIYHADITFLDQTQDGFFFFFSVTENIQNFHGNFLYITI